jgi:hypothetical protein
LTANIIAVSNWRGRKTTDRRQKQRISSKTNIFVLEIEISSSSNQNGDIFRETVVGTPDERVRTLKETGNDKEAEVNKKQKSNIEHTHMSGALTLILRSSLRS